MWRYVVKRLIALLIVLFCVAVIIFCILWFMPGDPAEIILGMNVPEADREALRVTMGLYTGTTYMIMPENMTKVVMGDKQSFLAGACEYDW